jgi:hypothetical protein
MTESALLILTERVIELTDHIVEISNIIYYQMALKDQDWWLAKMIDANLFVPPKDEEE